MLANIKPRENFVETTYVHSFRWETNPGSGFSFDCLEDGTPTVSESARENLWRAVFGLFEKPLVYDGIVPHVHSGWNPAEGECECGEIVYLEGDYGEGIPGDCGRLYNLSGQELAPREQWGEDWDW